jgi:oligoribonuclease (3'-5' exoribonuclease)
MIAIDIETTGLDSEKHQILEFAAVAETGEHFHRIIRYDDYVISEYCMRLHKQLLIEFLNDPLAIPIGALGWQFENWLGTIGSVIDNYDVVGVNFAGFDGLFLKKVPGFPKWNYRVLDLGSLYFDGRRKPGLEEIEPIDNAHRALPDARATMRGFLRKEKEILNND